MAQADFTRISSNIAALNALNSLRNINTRMGRAQLRLATGKRINSAADDPAGLTIALKMNARNYGMKAALNNIGDAKNMLAVAESGLSQIADLLTQMQAKSISGSSETLGTDERAAIKTQLEQFATQINDIVSQTTWNDGILLGGDVSKSLQTGAGVSDTTTWNLAQNHRATDVTGLNLGTTSDLITVVDSDIVAGYDGIETTSFQEVGLDDTGVALQDSFITELRSGTYEFKVIDKAGSGVGKATADVNDSDWGAGTVAVEAPTAGTSELQSGSYRIVFTSASGATQKAEIYNLETGSLVCEDTTGANYAGGSVSFTSTAVGPGAGNPTTLGKVGIMLNGTWADDTEINLEYIADGFGKVELREVHTDSEGAETFSTVAVDANGSDDTGTDATRAYFYAEENTAYNTGRGFNVTMAADVDNFVADPVTGDTTRIDLTEAGAASIDFASATDASGFATKVNNALTSVSRSLTSIGSLIARLDSKEEAVGVAQVNIEAAYNRIMNADMAYEQVEASKYLILQQTATAMLAQANMAPQGILSLFR